MPSLDPLNTRCRAWLDQLFTNYSETSTAREGFVSMCACTEPVRTGIDAVCVEYGQPKWPITMLNHTNIPGTERCFVFLFLAPYARTTRYEEAFLPECKNGLGRFAPSALPHY